MKANVKRLLIFIILSFLPLIILLPVINHILGEKLYLSGNAGVIYAVGVFGMFLPSIAHALTRLITKEGFRDCYLLPNFRWNVKYYFASVLGVLLLGFSEILIVWRLYLSAYSLSDIFHNKLGIASILLLVASSIIIFFPAFGEEWGWRAYMMPKLTELLGRPAAVIVGGIIWGLWHAPLTLSGHNFGLDYAGAPWTGILFMCLYCTLWNAILTFLTEKTKSIYPASFAHMLNDNVSATTILSLLSVQSVTTDAGNALSGIPNLLLLIPLAVFAVVCFVGVCREKKDGKQAAS